MTLCLQIYKMIQILQISLPKGATCSPSSGAVVDTVQGRLDSLSSLSTELGVQCLNMVKDASKFSCSSGLTSCKATEVVIIKDCRAQTIN